MAPTQQLERTSPVHPARASADWPAWRGPVPVTAGAVSAPLLLVDPVQAAALGLVSLTIGALGARTSPGRERRHHLAGAALGAATVITLVVPLTVSASPLGEALPEPAPSVPAPAS